VNRIAYLLIGVALTATGCLGIQHVEAPPAPPVVVAEPPPPPVLPGQATEANARQLLQSLDEELDRAAAGEPAAPVPAAPPG
jgi:hypothetical protein